MLGPTSPRSGRPDRLADRAVLAAVADMGGSASRRLYEVRRDRAVTAIIPSHNRPELIRRSVASALAQVGVDMRVIVVDDGSRVPVASLLDEDPRVRVIRLDPNGGVANARNRGIEAAETPWIAFLDDDDVWAPGKVAAQLDAMAQIGTLWSHTGNVRLDERLRPTKLWTPIGETIHPDTLRKVNVVSTPSSVVIATDVLRAVGGFDPRFSIMADWELWLRIIDDHPPTILPDPLIGYVVHETSMHRQGTGDLVRELRAVRSKHGRVGGPQTWKWIARTHRKNGHPLSALPLYVGPVLAHPLRVFSDRHVLARGVARWVARRRRRAPGFPAWVHELAATEGGSSPAP